VYVEVNVEFKKNERHKSGRKMARKLINK